MRNLIEKYKAFRKKLPVHPSFLLLFLWFVCTGTIVSFFIFVGVVLMHELGHYFVARKLGYKLDSFFLAPYGVSLNYRDNVFENSDEIKIALAGPIVNLTLASFCIAVWWIFPESYNYTDVFVAQSISLALFNLLPVYPMDGGRVFLSLLNKNMMRERAIKIIKYLNTAFACFFFALFFISCFIDFNPTFALAGVFLIIGLFQSGFESKYKLASLFKKKNKKFSKALVLYVNAEATMGELLKAIQPNRYTVFFVELPNCTTILDEKNVLNLSLLYPYNVSVKTVLQKEKTLLSKSV